jgi:hypothetical protein
MPVPVARLTAHYSLDVCTSADSDRLRLQNYIARLCCADEHPEIGHAFQSLEHASDKLQPQSSASDKLEPPNNASDKAELQSNSCSPQVQAQIQRSALTFHMLIVQ